MVSAEIHEIAGHGSPPVPLSPLENILCRIYDNFEGESMGAIAIKVRGRIELEPLRAALANLQRRHPRLRARVVSSKDGQRHFHLTEPPPPIPVEVQDCDADPLPWKEETHRRFLEKLDLAVGPLARMLVLRSRSGESCYAILLAHHAIFDGLSLLHAVDDLFRYYEEAERTGSPAPVASLPFFSCPRARPRGSPLQRLGILMQLLRLRRAKARKRWTPLPQSDGAPTSPPQWEVQVFSVEDTIALVRRCRQEKTSLDGALFAAVAGALRAVLPASESRVKLRFPIDIRGQLDGPAGPVTKQDLGCFVSAFEKIYAVDSGTTFWPLARLVHRDVRAFIEAGGPSLLYNLARFHRLRSSVRGLQRGTLHSSVLGVAPLEGRYGSLQLEECAQVYKNDRGGASINLVAITVQLRLNLTMHAGGLQEKFWERFREELAGQLRRAMAELQANGVQVGEPEEGTRERIAELVYRTLDEMNEELESEVKLDKSRDAVLYGQEARIDSMTFVSLIVAVEESIRREYGLSVTLANEKAMSSERSPFKTLGSMVDYVFDVVREAQESGRPGPHEQRGSLRQVHQRMDADSER